MNITSIPVEAFCIQDVAKLDPINVVLQDYGAGRGRIMIECFGLAWSSYWNAMSNRTIGQFVAQADIQYVVNNLIRTDRRTTKREEHYLARIVAAVQEALQAKERS